jgi:hypothetical protein
VPSVAEWVWLFQLWCKYREWNSGLCAAFWGSWSGFATSAVNVTLTNFKNDLKLPFAGIRHWSDGSLQTSFGNYWSSSPIDIHAHNLYFDSLIVSSQNGSNRAWGLSVRCFKN